jgi:ankyrin repeat protein
VTHSWLQPFKPALNSWLQAFRPALMLVVATVGLSAANADTRVIDAVRRGDAALVRALIQKKAPVVAAEADGTTALHIAVRNDALDLVQALLKAGAPANAATRYGVTPLALAATNGNPAIVGALLEGGANPNVASPQGETVLMEAARSGNLAVVDRLVAGGADVNARDSWRGETAVMRAAAENHAEVVRRLAASKADVNVRSKALAYPNIREDFSTMVFTAIPKGGFTALMLAAREGAYAAATALVESGASLDTTDPDGTTALVIAIINAHYDLAAMLIDKGANPSLGDTAGMAALYAAVDMRHQAPMINRPLAKPSGKLRAMDVIARLLDHRADPNQPLKTPLLMRQHEFGDGSLGDGATPLMRAAKAADAPLLTLLLEKGADPNRAMKNGTTALMVAASRPGRAAGGPERTLEALAVLLARGADVNAATPDGATALHQAVGRPDAIVRFLVQKGARLDAKDKFNRTPLDIANGVPGGAGRGRGGAPPEPPPVYEETAALLKELAVRSRGSSDPPR